MAPKFRGELGKKKKQPKKVKVVVYSTETRDDLIINKRVHVSRPNGFNSDFLYALEVLEREGAIDLLYQCPTQEGDYF